MRPEIAGIGDSADRRRGKIYDLTSFLYSTFQSSKIEGAAVQADCYKSTTGHRTKT